MELQFCFIARCRKNIHVPLHTHQALELVYYTEGSGQTLIGKQTHPAQNRKLAIIPEGVPHNQINKTDVTSICVGISDHDLTRLQGIWDDHTGILEKLFKLLVSELENKEPGFEYVSRGILLEIHGLIQRLSHQASSRSPKEILARKAIDIIRRHDGDLSVAEIASRLYVSPDYFRHLFHEYAGQSPIKYLLKTRIEKAESLLINPQLRIGEVATECGFENIYYFSRLFRKATGKTPSAFRKMKLAAARINGTCD